MAIKSATICGVPVTSAPHHEILAEIERGIADREIDRYISITNTESLYHALRLPDHRHYIQHAHLSLCDGIGVIAAGWFWGHRISRFNGPVLQLECCRYGVEHGWRHFFYGGSEGVADTLVENLRRKFPGMISVGAYCPPFRELTLDEDEVVVKLIGDACPDIVWVGLGLLKQEKWIAQHLGRMRVPWMIGVGAAFDYHSGAVPWAPSWMRALGLEWLFRLILQPRLRARRYWWSFVFVLEAAVSAVSTHVQRAFKQGWWS